LRDIGYTLAPILNPKLNYSYSPNNNTTTNNGKTKRIYTMICMRNMVLMNHSNKRRILEFKKQALEDEITFVDALMGQPLREEIPDRTERAEA
jgi:transcriptional regulator of met regulon